MIRRISSSMRGKSSGVNGRGKRKSYWYFSAWSWRPASIGVPGHRRLTASASTCSAEWRITSAPSGSLTVTMRSSASSTSGVRRSTRVPSTRPATVSRASRGPIDAATWRTVVPLVTSRSLPSGNVTRMLASIVSLPKKDPDLQGREDVSLVGAIGLEPMTSSV